MPAGWSDVKTDHDYPVAEEPDADPFGDEPGEADDLSIGVGYRRKDRDGLFDGLKQRLDLVAVMTTVIIAGVVGYVGINIMSSTRSNAGLSYNSTDVSQNSAFQNASHELELGLNSFFSQLGTVFVVIVLVVIIGYLMLLRGR